MCIICTCASDSAVCWPLHSAYPCLPGWHGFCYYTRGVVTDNIIRRLLSHMSKRRLGLEVRLFAVVFVVASLISGAFAYYIHNHQQQTLDEELASELLRAAHVFAANLDPDEIAQLRDLQSGDPLVEQYRQIAQRAAANAGLANAYTCMALEPGVCMWLATSSFEFGSRYEYAGLPNEAAWDAALGGQPAATPIYTDEFGQWKSGVVPIFNAGGDVVALAGFDIDASYVEEQLREELQQSLLLGGVMVAIWLVIAFLIARTIVRPVTAALGRFGVLVGRVADGDLTMEELPVRGNDEVGRLSRAFNQMVSRLRDLLAHVTESTRAVLNAAQELSSMSEQAAQGAEGAAAVVVQMASGATDQARVAGDVRNTMQQLQEAIAQIAAGAERSAGEVNQSAELLGQVAQGIDRVANEAQQLASDAGQTAVSARTGRDAMQRTVAGMDRIRDAVGNAAASMQNLAELSTQIGEITDVISEIAEQTNLLALNAAIEAARAGEHGRGFAVVADEVRRLAERSAESAGEISQLIENTQARTSEAVQAMETGRSEVEAGGQLAAEAGQALADILRLVESAANGIQEISRVAEEVQQNSQQVVIAFNEVAAVTEENSAATEEMAAGAGTVDEGVGHLATLSQDNAAAAEEVSATVDELSASAAEVAAAANELNTIAKGLEEQVARFRV